MDSAKTKKEAKIAYRSMLAALRSQCPRRRRDAGKYWAQRYAILTAYIGA
jgi:hypothetical protein